MKVEKEYIVELICELIKENKFIKGTISNPITKNNERSKINVKPLEIKNELAIQIEEFKNNKAFS